MAEELDPLPGPTRAQAREYRSLLKCTNVKIQKGGSSAELETRRKARPRGERGGDHAAYTGLGVGLTPPRSGS